MNQLDIFAAIQQRDRGVARVKAKNSDFVETAVLAVKFGVSKRAINAVRSRQNWKHIA